MSEIRRDLEEFKNKIENVNQLIEVMIDTKSIMSDFSDKIMMMDSLIEDIKSHHEFLMDKVVQKTKDFTIETEQKYTSLKDGFIKSVTENDQKTFEKTLNHIDKKTHELITSNIEANQKSLHELKNELTTLENALNVNHASTNKMIQNEAEQKHQDTLKQINKQTHELITSNIEANQKSLHELKNELTTLENALNVNHASTNKMIQNEAEQKHQDTLKQINKQTHELITSNIEANQKSLQELKNELNTLSLLINQNNSAYVDLVHSESDKNNKHFSYLLLGMFGNVFLTIIILYMMYNG